MVDSPQVPVLSSHDSMKGDGVIKKKGKHVRFSSRITVKKRDDFMCDEKNKNNVGVLSSPSTWWSPDEMTELRHAAKVSSREVSRNIWMLGAFEEAHRIARQLAATVDDEAGLCSILEGQIPHVSQELVSWCRYGHSRRGLERWSSKFHNAARAEAAKRARQKIEEIKKSDPELIRRTYERLTRSSKIFARFMGYADAAALEPIVLEDKRSTSCCDQSCVPPTPANTPTRDDKITCRLRINRQ